jgi:magnesium transporter
MTDLCLYYPASGAPQACTLASADQYLSRDSGLLWVDLVDPSAAQLDEIGRALHLHELAMEDALTTHQRPKLEEYGEHLFLSAKTAQLWESSLLLADVHLFVGKRFLVLIRHGQTGLPMMHERFNRHRHPLDAAHALYQVLDAIVDHYRPVMQGLTARFIGLESQLLAQSLGRRELEALYTLKRELATLRDAVDPLEGLITDLLRLYPEIAGKSLKAYFRDVQDHAQRLLQEIDLLRGHASDAMQFQLALQTLKQNTSVQKLAGWGAILAIPTVIFSLYGMNFDWMPELHWKPAYPLVLLATLSGSGILYYRLRKRGWI